MSIERRIARASSKSKALPVTGYIEPTAAGETITWNSWSETPSGDRTWPITLFPYASGSNYDGGTVTLSNYRVLVDDAHVLRRSVLVQGGHGTYGIAYIGAPTRRIRAICAALDAYPLLDEDEHSNLETDLEMEQWADHGRSDFRSALVKEFGDGLDEMLDTMDAGFVESTDEKAAYEARVSPATRLLDMTWYAFGSQHGDGGRTFESGDSCHFYIDDAVKWLREERDIGFALVLGHIKYGELGTFGVARDAGLEGRIPAAREILALWPDLVIVNLDDDGTEESDGSDGCIMVANGLERECTHK